MYLKNNLIKGRGSYLYKCFFFLIYNELYIDKEIEFGI